MPKPYPLGNASKGGTIGIVRRAMLQRIRRPHTPENTHE